MFQSAYAGKRVLVTGHTGFKGGWISLWLQSLGAQAHGISLPAPTAPSLHEILAGRVFTAETFCDIRDFAALSAAVRKIRPELVFHMAAQPLVRRSYAEPLETFHTNALGTANLLEAVRRAALPCPVVVVTSDKCYENREWEFAYREVDGLGGHDVYSMSKAATELVAQAWQKSFVTPSSNLGPITTVRAGNVIGGGDYAQDRIVPDCVRALLNNQRILIRNPRAVRPWQHVLECLSGYLLVGSLLMLEGKSSRAATPFNFGPDASSRQPVRRLVEEVLKSWPGEWDDGSNPNSPHEATLLSLSIEKAAAVLAWRPAWGFERAIRETINWYSERHINQNQAMLEFSLSQISAYVSAAREQGIAWASHSVHE